MRVAQSVLFGLVGLLCTVTASTVTPTPNISKRQTAVTVTNDGCTAICWSLAGLVEDQSGTDCDVYCSEGFSTSTPTSTAIATATFSSTSTATTTTSTSTSLSKAIATVTPSAEAALNRRRGITVTVVHATKAALNQRTAFSTTDGDCTVVCWDLMPGTECNVQCSSDFETKMPVPSKAARFANVVARENFQAHQVREARLARKFGGLAARVDPTTVFVTTTPVDCSTITSTITGIPIVHPMQAAPNASSSEAAAVLSSEARTALSLAQQAQSAIPSAASSALSKAGVSEASASLSSAAATAPIWANVTNPKPAYTGTVVKVSSTKTTSKVVALTVSANATATSTSSETTTASTTTTGSLSVSVPGVSVPSVTVSGTSISTFFPATGAAPEYSVPTGLVLFLLIGLAANVAFLI